MANMIRSPRPWRLGFTLVELLVVIGIIALLISILLPALSTAREQGATIKCLSNLRQLGMSAVIYSQNNRNVLVPCDITSPDGTVRYESWASILVTENYLPYPPYKNKTVPLTDDTALKCPSGNMDVAGNAYITKRNDALNSAAEVCVSTIANPGLAVWSWYAPNGTSGSDKGIPLPRCGIGFPKGRRASDIIKPTQVVFLFDGVGAVNVHGSPNRVSARHNKMSVTNLLMFDGHAESIRTADIPGGMVAPIDAFSKANLKGKPAPHWRLDQ